MKPPYEITSKILYLISSISEKLGQIKSVENAMPSPMLRKQNTIKTIHHSLKIEGNSLSEQQITEMIDHKRVVGPKKDILEVSNAIKVYEQLNHFDPFSEASFLKAHLTLMKGLVDDAGGYRTSGVGVVKGDEVQHVAPPYQNVSFLMKDLFAYLKTSKDLPLIKSCVFHYELEFIHPFIDGNGRMGRLWQTLVLCELHEVFGVLPFESLISKNQKKYYDVLATCDKLGNSTLFIEYMLDLIDTSMRAYLNETRKPLGQAERVEHFVTQNEGTFTRKDYMVFYPSISSATASRDLKKAVENESLETFGEKNKTSYRKKR